MSQIVGIGTDIVSLTRIADLYERFGDKFAQRILSVKELSNFESHTNPVNFLAKRFAAKEAVTKALGTGIGKEIGFHDISVFNHSSGQPFIDFSPRVQAFLQSLQVGQTHISLSDEVDYALAFVVISQE